MNDLKPCMCCESNDIEIITHEEKYHTRKIAKCMDCGARGSVCDSKEEAIEAWNTRPAEDAKDREIERLKTALKQIAILRITAPEMKANKFPSCAEDAFCNLFCTMGDIAKTALSNAPDTGKMEEK